MVKRILALCLVAGTCFGDAATTNAPANLSYSFADPAFLLSIPATPRRPPTLTGLVAYWPMNEGAGATTNRDAWSTNTLGLRASPVWITNGFPNTNALVFPGANSACTSAITAAFNIGTNDFSITAWVCHTNSYWQSSSTIFRIPQVNGPALSVSSGNTVNLNMGGTTGVGFPTGSITNNQWEFIAVSRRAMTNFYSWINGAGIAANISRGATNAATGNALVCIGNYYDIPNFNWSGYIEEVMLYNGYALTTNDVSLLYHNYYGRP